jgi:integrase
VSVRKRKWKTGGVEREAWVADYVDGTGIRRNKQFRLKKDAEAFAKRSGVEVMDGVHVADSASATVAEAAKLWHASKARAGREQSTVDQYRQHIELHIVPLIGETKLNSLTVPVVRAFEEKLLDSGRSPALVRKVLVSLGSIIADAQERGLATRNPVRDMRGRRGAHDSRAEKRARGRLEVGTDIPTPAEVKAIVGALKGRWRPLLMTAVFTGLRASELRGLAWSDVDLAKGTIRVRQRADRFNAIGRPKSAAGDRTVPLAPIVVNTLKEWKLACPKRDTGKTDAEGKPVKMLDLAFPNGEGKVESLANIINRGLIPAQIAAGVTVETGKIDEQGRPILAAKYSGMHALRHFYASWCVNRRADGGLELPPKTVQGRLGHASITITMDTYGHLFPSSDDTGEMAAAERALLG